MEITTIEKRTINEISMDEEMASEIDAESII